MNRLIRSACIAVLAAPALCMAASPGAQLIVGGQSYAIPTTFRPSTGTYIIGNAGPESAGWSMLTPEFRIQVNGELDGDGLPNLDYGLTVEDFGAPSSFLFNFSTPILPITGPNAVEGYIVGSITDATGDGVAITPTQPDRDGDGIPEVQIAELGSPATNMGIDVGPITAATWTAPAGTVYQYGLTGEIPKFGPGPGPWDSLSATVAFSLTGGSDVAALVGHMSAAPKSVPEPGLAFAIGLVPMILRRSRR